MKSFRMLKHSLETRMKAVACKRCMCFLAGSEDCFLFALLDGNCKDAVGVLVTQHKCVLVVGAGCNRKTAGLVGERCFNDGRLSSSWCCGC